MLAVTDVGRGLTVTVTVAVLEQALLSVPVTVYDVVAPGVAVTDAPVAALSEADGVQLYVAAPEAVKVVLSSAQMELLDALAVTTGKSRMMTLVVVV
jgi:hypothetical protein